ncbi:MAG: hypothetical protein RLY71_3781 [Pseudomonadota bacterium]|jgi:hypothetical protein
MATQTKTGTAGQAAALPSSIRADVETVWTASNDLNAALSCKLLPLLRAAENLADCRRVLDDIDNMSQIRPGVHEQMQTLCESWRNPLDTSGHDLVYGLLNLATNLCLEQVEASEQLTDAVGRISKATKGGAA